MTLKLVLNTSKVIGIVPDIHKPTIELKGRNRPLTAVTFWNSEQKKKRGKVHLSGKSEH